MTPDNPNLLIAERMGEEGWEKCQECGGYGKLNDRDQGDFLDARRLTPDIPCPTCHGKGKVPRHFEDSAITLELVEWARSQEWWMTTHGEICKWKYRDRITNKLRDFANQVAISHHTAVEVAASIRNLIAEAIEEKKHA